MGFIKNLFTPNKNGLLSNQEFFNRLYKFFAMGAVTLTVAPYTFLLLFSSIGVPPALSFVLTFLLICFGYFLQAIYGGITKLKREEGGAAYEKGVVYFKAGKAVLPITICAVLSIIPFHVTHAYLKWRYEVGLDLIYDSDALMPVVAVLVAFVPMLIGIILWFYPYDRIISSKTIFVFLAAHLLSLLLSMVIPGFTTFCFIIFLLFTLIIFNQSYLIQLMDRAKVGSLTPQMRFYNIALVCMVIAAVSVTLLLVVTVVIGVVVLFRILLFFALAAVLGDDATTYQKADKVADAAGGEMFSGIMEFQSNTEVAFFFTLFCILVCSAVLFFIIIRKVNLIKIIGNFINALFSNIMEFFANLFYFNRMGRDSVEYFDYTDDERQVDNSSYKRHSVQDFKPRKTYRDFAHRLNSLKSYSEKLGYAYNTLVSFWNSMDFMLNVSDTPREIGEKVKKRSEIKKVDEMTALFERVKYADSDETDDGLLEEMCGLIRKYYD